MKLKTRIRAKPKLKKLKVFNEGDWVDDFYRGRELTFDDLEKMKGELIVLDYSTVSHPWYKVVRVKDIIPDFGDYRRLVFTDGSRKDGGTGQISENFFKDDYAHRSYAWELNRKGGRPNVGES